MKIKYLWGVRGRHNILISLVLPHQIVPDSFSLYRCFSRRNTQEPEIERSHFQNISGLQREIMVIYPNVTVAILEGVQIGMKMSVNIVMNIICFLTLVATVNGFLHWIGHFVFAFTLDLNVIVMYALYPVTIIMGVAPYDRLQAARLIGVKLLQNEFVAYKDLGLQVKGRDSGTMPKFDNVTGLTNWVDESTEIIVTYSACGFANLSGLSVMVGAISVFCPKRRTEIAGMIIRAYLAASTVSMMNGCLASMLLPDVLIKCEDLLTNKDWSQATVSRLFECCTRGDVIITNADIGRCCAFDWPHPYETACA